MVETRAAEARNGARMERVLLSTARGRRGDALFVVYSPSNTNRFSRSLNGFELGTPCPPSCEKSSGIFSNAPISASARRLEIIWSATPCT